MNLILSFLNYSEYVFWFVIVFSLIVFVHEFGHYYIAKINKVEIEKFSIGFGPAILKYQDKAKTIWQLSAIPLGGYVKFAGEMYANDKTDQKVRENKKLFLNKSALQKASIVLAGPIANFLLGIIIFILVFIFFGKNFTPPIIGTLIKDSPAFNSDLKIGDEIIEVNNSKVSSFEDIYNILDERLLEEINFVIRRNNQTIYSKVLPEHKFTETFAGSKRKVNFVGFLPQIKPIVNKVSEDSPAMSAGFKKGDVILQINKNYVKDINQVITIIKDKPNTNINIYIERNGKVFKKSIKPKLVKLNDGNKVGQIGITFALERKKINIFEAVYLSFFSFIDITKKTLQAFTEIIFGKRDHCEMGGPILIAKVSNDVANTDMIAFISLIAIISFNLGIINLFPLPLLDGGHFFTYLAEYFSGREIKYNVFKYIQVFGVLIVFSLMSFSILNDIYCRVLN